MSAIELRNITKIYKKNVVIENLDLEIQDKEFFGIVGPSGAGKTTILKIIAGIEKPTRGEVLIDGQIANEMSPKDRNVSMVFQNCIVYPHLNIFENISFSLMVKKIPKEQISKLTSEVAELLEISHLLRYYPDELSAGELKKVAIAKGLVRKPRFFLFDEPLGNLDSTTKWLLKNEFKKIRQYRQATTIYATNNLQEVTALCDKICIINKGKKQQDGSPNEVCSNPANKFVAEFVVYPQ